MRIEAQNVTFGYRKGMPVLENIDFSVQQGERVAVVGPSGCGKSTLLKLLAGWLQPEQGRVLWGGAAVSNKGPYPVQMILQHPEQAVDPRWRMRRVLEEAGPLQQPVLEALGIDAAWLQRYPAELSGGELQRFCVARALSCDLRFLLADEISTMLDAVTQAQIWQLVLQQCRARGLGLVMVTHHLPLAEQVATRIVEMKDLQHGKKGN